MTSPTPTETALAEVLRRLAALDPETPEFGKDLGEYAMRGSNETEIVLYMLTIMERVREANQKRFYQFYCDVRNVVKQHNPTGKSWFLEP